MVDTEQTLSGIEIIRRRLLKFVPENILLISNMAAVVLGLIFGLIVKTYDLYEVEQEGFQEEFLMRIPQSVTVPLILTTVFTGVAGFSINTSRKVALHAGVYSIFTTLVSVTTGLILVLTIKPCGDSPGLIGYGSEGDGGFSAVDDILDLVRNMVPKNLLQACSQQYQTKRHEFFGSVVHSNSTKNDTEVMGGNFVEEMNTLGLIVISFVSGLALNKMGERGRMLVDIANTINEIIKFGVGLIIWLLPVALFFMTMEFIVENHDWKVILQLGKFMGTVIAGQVIHGAGVLSLIYLVFARRNPLSVIRGVSPALVNAARVSSSSATFPLTLRCCVETLKIDPQIAHFVLPIGTNANMVGTVLYETVAVVFIAQLNGTHLKLSQLITIGVMAAVSSIEAVGIPATGAVRTVFILTTVGLSARNACILVVVEFLLDRCNAVVNVLGNCIGVSLVHEVSKQELEEIELQDQERARMGPALEEEEDIFCPAEEDSSYSATSHL